MSDPRERFRARRVRALEALGDGAMVLPAASPLLRGGDTELRYRPDGELYYLTGLREPGALLLLRGFADEERTILFVRSRDPTAERWSGLRLGPEAAAERLGLEAARSIETLPETLPSLLLGADRVFFRLGVHPPVEVLVREALRTARARGPRKGTGPRGVVDPGEILDELRLRKDPDEIRALEEAARLTLAGFRKGLAGVAPGAGEWEVEAEMEAEFRRSGGDGPAFPTIVASGPNACVLHYVENARRMEAGEVVLMDGGAERAMYGGDVSRTVPVSGRFSPEQRDVYQIVEAARRAAVERVAPGVRTDEVEERALRTLLEGLRTLSVLEGEVDELLEARAHRPFFPHRVSHWLGLDTHDPGDYLRDGSARSLEPGMVFTVEPGLYFPPEGGGLVPEGEEAALERAAPFRGIGVRIEDDVLVTGAGARVLTEGLPTGADEVEDAVRGSSSS